MNIELVSHCFQYSTLLKHQLSSLVRFPPASSRVTMTVFYTSEDAKTAQLLEWFGRVEVANVVWNWQNQPAVEVCHRSIGRNAAALATQADWVWFCDADHWFGAACWQAFHGIPKAKHALVFPRLVNVHRTHELGDALIERTRDTVGLVSADVSEFCPKKMNRAIGGVQIANGDVCRQKGYLPESERAQRPFASPIWVRTREDVWFRTHWDTHGAAMDIPEVYRIRHSKAGRNVPGLNL